MFAVEIASSPKDRLRAQERINLRLQGRLEQRRQDLLRARVFRSVGIICAAMVVSSLAAIVGWEAGLNHHSFTATSLPSFTALALVVLPLSAAAGLLFLLLVEREIKETDSFLVQNGIALDLLRCSLERQDPSTT